jgi:type I restriction enzyme S subunit
VALDEIAEKITGFWGASVPSDRAPHDVKVIRAGDITTLGKLTGFAERYFSDSELTKARCQKHDVVVTVSGNGLGKTWLVDRQYGLSASNFVRILRARSGRVYGPFLVESLRSEGAQRLLAEHTATSAYPNLRPSFFSARWLPLPPLDEQTAIADILSDMDAEIVALERRRDKTKQIKQGMMQQLLTGRVRLVKPQVPVAQAKANSKEPNAHSWAFNEAVVISALAKQFGSEQFPLGRKRYTKLSYLLHRHAEKQAEGYLKKAAGPYNPKTKYGGPERIAVENGYVREHKSGPYRGFVVADNISQAEGYFEKWYGSNSIQWLGQFRRRRNDDLELLATVDMAAEELRAVDKDVNVDSVKDVIRNHPEWQAKLNRPVFSDANIAKAIETCRMLFC